MVQYLSVTVRPLELMKLTRIKSIFLVTRSLTEALVVTLRSQNNKYLATFAMIPDKALTEKTMPKIL